MSAPARILVVDDTPLNVTLLEDILTARGYEVATAGDGVEALEKVASRAPDLVLLDIMMPRMNGYEVLEHLRADAKLRHIPVIMISAVDEIESVIRCIEQGAEDYLSKPFNATLLRARVSASLEKKLLRDEVRASLARLERELDAARTLQLGMLPTSVPKGSLECPVQVHALMAPAREVGGDLYDFFYPASGIFCFLVGDVSGKGAPAAMFMARTQSLVRMAVKIWRRTSGSDMSPGGIADAVNTELYDNNRDRMFVTMFLGLLDTRTGVLAYVNAGHLQPYLLRGSSGIEQIAGKPEAPLAVRSRSQYQNRSVVLNPGDALFVCTDGVIEAVNENGELYGNDRLKANLMTGRGDTPEDIVQLVKERVDAFTGHAPMADDLTMVALRWYPTQPRMTTELVIANDLAQLAVLTETMERIGAEQDVPGKALVHIQVALDEIVTNIIKYAWTDGGSHEIHIRIAVLADGVRLEIIDDGVAFNPLLAPPPERPSSGPRRPGGVGLHMVRQLVDALEYARIDGCNHITLIKKCVLGATNP